MGSRDQQRGKDGPQITCTFFAAIGDGRKTGRKGGLAGVSNDNNEFLFLNSNRTE